MTTDLSHFGLVGGGLAALREAGSLILKHLDKVLDHFYAAGEGDPATARFFPNKSVIAHARAAQKAHWSLLLAGEFAEAYVNSTNRIGQVHFRIQLPFQLYLSSYAGAAAEMQRILIEQAGRFGGRGRAIRMVNALTRALAMDTALVIEAYFRSQQAEQKIAMDQLVAGINRMARKDFSEVIGEDGFPRQFDPVRLAYNEAVTNVGAICEQLSASMQRLSQSGAQVMRGAQDLSARTESQAATLEETAAAMHEISESMRGTAETTQLSTRVANATRASAEEGGNVVTAAVQKMQEIEGSFRQISTIITMIDDIAFQTNLLALNAGVEAARAGEAGRGFAVVASEVRALAQRASESAREIKRHITESSRHVVDGVEMVGQTGVVFDRIVKDVIGLTDQVTSIARASNEQATSLAEINLGVTQLDSATQQNAGLAESVIMAIGTIISNSDALNALVSSFNVAQAEEAWDMRRRA